MHIHHTHPQFSDSFFKRYEQMQKFSLKHPVLSQKKELLQSLDANQLDSLPQKLHAFTFLVEEEERPLWAKTKFDVTKSAFEPYKPAESLSDEQREFVKSKQSIVAQTCTNSFTHLIESAVISDTKNYATIGHDYHHFQTAVDAAEQLSALHAHLDSQVYLAIKIQKKLSAQAHTISSDVAALKESHESQLGLMARLPSFRFE